MEAEEPLSRLSSRLALLWRRSWRRVVVLVSVVTAVIALLVMLGPDGATYEEYLQLQEGMSRQDVAAIIGEADYWYHDEGDNQVTSWVNDKDGTYIRAVFDKTDVLIEVSWESGWDTAREGDWEWE